MRTTFYFSHDYNSREDPKIKNLIFKQGWVGYGLYWAIIELLYQNEGYYVWDSEIIAYDLRAEEDIIEWIVEDSKLFNFKEEKFYSRSCLERIKIRKTKSDKARKSAKTRWAKEKQKDANVIQPQSNRNADAMLLKDIKGKEIKEKNNKEKSTVKTADVVHPFFENKKFVLMFNEFKNHRTKLKYPMTPYAQKLMLGKLDKISPEDVELATEILKQSINKGWRDVFPLKNIPISKIEDSKEKTKKKYNL